MNPMPELAPQLKQLRLSGILDSLEMRNREAIENKMAYPDFLALLIHDEVARREQKQHPRAPRRLPLPEEARAVRLRLRQERQPPLVEELATCRYIDEQVAVLVRKGYDVLFTTQSQLLGSLHAARATQAYERKFQTLVRVDLLIIDDFGLKPLRAPQDQICTISSPSATSRPPPSLRPTSTSPSGARRS